jgi:hypothetical protein
MSAVGAGWVGPNARDTSAIGSLAGANVMVRV